MWSWDQRDRYFYKASAQQLHITDNFTLVDKC
jgi:hypothetical protein